MKNEPSNIIFDTCISKEEMVMYLQKNNDAKTSLKINNHLQSCEYCAEAIKGLQQLPDLSILNTLSSAWQAKTGVKTSAYKTKVFSKFIFGGISIVIIISSIILIKGVYHDNEIKNLPVQKNDLNVSYEKENPAFPEKENSENILTLPEKKNNSAVLLNIEKKSSEEITKIPSRESFTLNEAPTVRMLAKHPHSDTYSIIYIEKLKTVDYSKKYESKQPQLDKLMPDVSARFENREQQNKVMEESSNQLYSLKYENVLAMALRNMNKEFYNNALANFNLVLQYFPEDMNCNFYKALTYEKMRRLDDAENLLVSISSDLVNAFGEEAKWHLAVVKMKLNKSTAAKKILEEIASENGFYKSQALEKLKEMKEE